MVREIGALLYLSECAVGFHFQLVQDGFSSPRSFMSSLLGLPEGRGWSPARATVEASTTNRSPGTAVPLPGDWW